MNKQSHMHFRLIAASLFFTTTAMLTAPVQAHHSAAKYDSKQAVTITGAVTKYEWANPHVYIFIEQITDTGKKIEWEIEGGPPSIMRRMGWSVQTLHVGDLITVGGSPARDANDKSLIANTIKRADSTLLDFRKDMQGFASASDAPKFSARVSREFG